MNKHQKAYEDLIYFRKHVQPFERWNKLSKECRDVNLPPVYGEYHHIKPKSLYPELVKDPDNIVCLTAYEHILAHKYLALWYKDEFGENDWRYIKMWQAYDRTILDQNGDIRLSDEEAAKMKIESSRIKSISQLGKPLSEKHKAAIKRGLNNPETKKKISLRRKGKPLSKANRDSITRTWRTEKKRKEQSERAIKKLEDPQVHINISNGNRRRYEKKDEREKTKQRNLQYFKLHPEARKKHSEDMKGRISLYDITNRKHIRVKPEFVQKFLDEGWQLGTLLYNLVKRGKTAGKLTIIRVCPWKLEKYLKPSKKFPNKNPKWHLENPSNGG